MRILLFSIILFFSHSIFAQTECSYYHKKYCDVGEGLPMKYDSQSKSAILGKGQISEFHMVAYKGQDYRITICAEENLGSEVQFRIYEKKRELVKIKVEEIVEEEPYEEVTTEDSYEEQEYDEYSTGSFDDYSEDTYEDTYSDYEEETVEEVVSNKPKFKLVKEMLYDNADDGFNNMLEFTSEGSMSLIVEVIVPGEESVSKLKIREVGCVGVLIEHAKSRQSGF